MAHCKHKLCAACCVSVCVLNCAHTKAEHWWPFSGSIVNGTGFVWERKTHRNRGRVPCSWPWAKLSLQRNIWHSTGEGEKNHIYQWSLHNLSSQRHWQPRITIQLVVLKSKVHVISTKTLRHRDRTLSRCFSELCCTTRLSCHSSHSPVRGKNS